MTSTFRVGDKVQHVPSGRVGVVVKVYEDGLLVEVGKNDYMRFASNEWRGL